MLLLVPAALDRRQPRRRPCRAAWSSSSARAPAPCATVALAFLLRGQPGRGDRRAARRPHGCVGGTEWDRRRVHLGRLRRLHLRRVRARRARPAPDPAPGMGRRPADERPAVARRSVAQHWPGWRSWAPVLPRVRCSSTRARRRPRRSPALIVYRAFALAGLRPRRALAGLALLANLFLMYTSGEPVDYVVPGQPAAAGGRTLSR